LAPLADLAARYRVAVILVTHLNKSGSGKALYKAMGSLAFVAAARSAWLVTADKENPQRRLFLPMKNNLGNDSTGLAYSIIGEEQQAHICWEREPVSIKADDALTDDNGEERRTGPKPRARNAAEDWLRQLLASGPTPSAEVRKAAADANIAWATVRRAQESIGVTPYQVVRNGSNVWMWSLPPVAQEADAHGPPT
jgi:hypothetical protein